MTKRPFTVLFLIFVLVGYIIGYGGSLLASFSSESAPGQALPVVSTLQASEYGMWVWNAEVVTDTVARDAFFTFAQIKNVNKAYLYAFDLLLGHSQNLANFITTADAQNVAVDLLAGDPAWTLTPNHPIALDFVNEAITFTQSMDAGIQPTGVHLDVEPYLLPEWNSDQPGTITQYLNLLQEIKQDLTASGTGLSLIVDIPFWFDTITATYQAQTKPLNQHVQDIADRVVIMDYRDFAEGVDGIIFHAQDEMNYGESIAREVIIGVETNPALPEKVTFFEEGETVMEQELALTDQFFQSSPAFAGLAIHDYLGYQTMAPIRYIYLPVIQ